MAKKKVKDYNKERKLWSNWKVTKRATWDKEWKHKKTGTILNLSSEGPGPFADEATWDLDIKYPDGEDVLYDYRDDVAIRMTTKDGLNILVVNKYGILEEISTFSLKGWYHFKIEFNIETGYDLTIIKILGTEVFSGHFDFFRKPEYFTQLYFATYTLGTTFYVDNIIIILEQPANPVYPLDVYIPIIIISFMGIITIILFIKFPKLENKKYSKKRR